LHIRRVSDIETVELFMHCLCDILTVMLQDVENIFRNWNETVAFD